MLSLAKPLEILSLNSVVPENIHTPIRREFRLPGFSISINDKLFEGRSIAVVYTTYAVAKRKPETVMIFLQIILHFAVHVYVFHTFIISSSSFHRFIISQFNDLLPVGL